MFNSILSWINEIIFIQHLSKYFQLHELLIPIYILFVLNRTSLISLSFIIIRTTQINFSLIQNIFLYVSVITIHQKLFWDLHSGCFANSLIWIKYYDRKLLSVIIISGELRRAETFQTNSRKILNDHSIKIAYSGYKELQVNQIRANNQRLRIRR